MVFFGHPTRTRIPAILRKAAVSALSLTLLLLGCSGGGAAPAAITPVLPVTPTATAKAKFVYTGNQGASLSGYSVNTTTGQLTALTGFPLSAGVNPTALAHDPLNRFLFVADISAGMLHVYAIDGTSGSLAEVSPSPYPVPSSAPTYAPEPVAIAVDPSGTHIYVVGQGNNLVDAYTLSSTGVLTPVAGSPFSTGNLGPAYTIGNGILTNAAGTSLYVQDVYNLYVFSIDAATGALKLQQTIAGPSSGFGLALDPAGAYIYAVGSGNNFIQAYAINGTTGLLTLSKSSSMLEQNGAYTITVAPSGKFAYTIEANNLLVSYAVQNGQFTPVGTAFAGVNGMQIGIDPTSSFVYVPQACSYCINGVYNVVNEFAIGSNGALTRMPTGTIAAGKTPWGITITTQ